MELRVKIYSSCLPLVVWQRAHHLTASVNTQYSDIPSWRVRCCFFFFFLSLSYLFIVSIKEKGDYQNLAHLKLPCFLIRAPWFSLLHRRGWKHYTRSHTEAVKKRPRSKRIPLSPNPSQTHSTELSGKTSETARSEQTHFMDLWQPLVKAHLGWTGGAGTTMCWLHFCHSCCGMAWINHRAEVRTASP